MQSRDFKAARGASEERIQSLGSFERPAILLIIFEMVSSYCFRAAAAVYVAASISEVLPLYHVDLSCYLSLSLTGIFEMTSMNETPRVVIRLTFLIPSGAVISHIA